jgi:hypothetical protein
LIYAARNIYFIDGSRKHQRMHNLITGWDRVDHKNHDGLDNRMVNLRFDPGGKNPKNRSPQTGTLSPYKGVMLRRSSGRWFVQITVDRCIKRVGTFGSEIDAALAYDAAAEIGHGEWACLNRDCFPEVMLAYHGHPH